MDKRIGFGNGEGKNNWEFFNVPHVGTIPSQPLPAVTFQQITKSHPLVDLPNRLIHSHSTSQDGLKINYTSVQSRAKVLLKCYFL